MCAVSGVGCWSISLTRDAEQAYRGKGNIICGSQDEIEREEYTDRNADWNVWRMEAMFHYFWEGMQSGLPKILVFLTMLTFSGSECG